MLSESKNCAVWVLLLVVILLIVPFPAVGYPLTAYSSSTVSLDVCEVCIVGDGTIAGIGYFVNGNPSISQVFVTKDEEVLITISSLPAGKRLQPTLSGTAELELTTDSVRLYDIRSERVIITLSFGTSSIPEHPTDEPTESDDPVRPDVPDTPGTPDTPGADTPGSDEPGSDKPGSDEPGLDEPGADGPFVPILPPAGSVYNIAGSIPLAAGALLLFLLVFWRRKVYRILKAHAKQHGEKPDKQQLKATAAAVVALLQNKELYPEWRKNKETLARLLADIERALDETQYPQSIPREPVVTDIIKAAKGRINRHRL